MSLAEAGRSVSCARVRVASAAPGAVLDQVVGRRARRRGAPAPRWAKTMRPLALARVEEEGELERLQGLARRHDAVDDEAAERAGERAGVVGGEAVVVEDGGDGGAERRAGEAAGEPVAEPPVGAVAPHVGVGGEGRIGPRVPAVDVDVGEIDHAARRRRSRSGWRRRRSADRRDRRPRGRPAGSGAA